MKMKERKLVEEILLLPPNDEDLRIKTKLNYRYKST